MIIYSGTSTGPDSNNFATQKLVDTADTTLYPGKSIELVTVMPSCGKPTQTDVYLGIKKEHIGEDGWNIHPANPNGYKPIRWWFGKTPDCPAAPSAPAPTPAPTPTTPTPPAPPQTTPTPTPTPTTPVIVCNAGREIKSGKITEVKEGGLAKATVVIAEGCTIEITLASYTAPAPTYELPQDVYKWQTKMLGPGTHQFVVDVPPCFNQVDLARGAVIMRLTPTNTYGIRKLDYENGGTKKCS